MDVIPFRSIGLICFGDSRSVVRQKLGGEFEVFLKTEGVEGDAFDHLGLHVYYDNLGNTEFVEGFEDADIRFRGVEFLGRDLEEVVKEMSPHSSVELDRCGVIFYEVGIAIYAPRGIVEGVAAHRQGYYD